MVVFDSWKFREILKSIVEKKELNGDRISSKQQLYVQIGEELHVSPETVKYWQRDKSSGPDSRTPELLDELEPRGRNRASAADRPARRRSHRRP